MAVPAVGAGEAHARLGEALELSPGRIEVRRTYAGFLGKTGRLSEAETQIRQDPYTPSAVALSNLGKNHYFARRYNEAIAEYRQAIRIYQPLIPHIHADLGIAYVFDGMGRKGIEELEFVRRSSKTITAFSGQLGYAYAIEGGAADANRILSELLARKDQVDSLSTANRSDLCGLGDRDRAFEWLNRAVMQRDADLFLEVDPIYDPLRADARFAGLIRSIHLD